MLALWTALGLTGGGLSTRFGDLVAVPECIVTATRVQGGSALGAGIPLGAPVWQQFLDPADRLPFAYDFGPLLADGEMLGKIDEIALSPIATELGVFIDTEVDYWPIIAGPKRTHIQLWFNVLPRFWESGAFEATGTQFPVFFRTSTAGRPSKRFDRTAVMAMRQQ